MSSPNIYNIKKKKKTMKRIKSICNMIKKKGGGGATCHFELN